MSNDIHEKLFKQIFGHTLTKLSNKLINEKKKKKNRIILTNNKNEEKLYEECQTSYCRHSVIYGGLEVR